MSYQNIIVETRGKVGLITLDRPKALNALNDKLIDEIGTALDGFEADPNIGCMVITGSDKAFAAGADIGAMAGWNFMDVYKTDYISRNWDRIGRCRKPLIAAVAGFSLPIVMMIKESVNRAFESGLHEGLLFERRTFHSAFALADQKEGMAAFVEKRKPVFRDT